MATKQWTPKTRDELKKLVDGGISLGDIEVIFITDMSELFKDSTRTDFSGIEEWNVGNVTNMNAMFRNAKHFNANINSWNVSRVTQMESMFEGAESFNQPLDKWDTSNVKDMSHMFKNAKAFNQNINSWNVSKVGNIHSMFYGAESFNQSIDDWKLGDFLKIPDKMQLYNWDTPTKNFYISLEKRAWEIQINLNLFANSPFASNPPKWYKKELEWFVKRYEEREKEIEEIYQNIARFQKENAEYDKKEEAKQETKDTIIGLIILAALGYGIYRFIKWLFF